ncbi:alanine racemase [Paenibacillus sp. PAMC21692]|uniref:alanine racemase n=1 Tax=Paenibacillus sp. PAMC21692 TaxID=2762320 RepID=UPI0021C28A2B|nr:alanine racemase [Paenibacillus sp. PAMC21692]
MYRDTVAQVDLSAIRDNIGDIKASLPAGVKLMAVVKAGGYGHGSAESAAMAERGGADMLAVAYLDEALELRAKGIALPILILTPIHPAEVMFALEHDLMVTVTEADWFRRMAPYRPSSCPAKLQVHVKADTGLGRIGLRTREEWEALVPWLKAEDVEVAGFYTHFATAGQADTGFLERQYRTFLEMKAWVKASGVEVSNYHCAGSAAALRFPGLAMDMVRIGAAMFGFYPEKLVRSVSLRPAMKLRSTLLQVKLLRKGECIGYDNSYIAEGDEWIGTVPIGYADGWSQSLRGSEMLVEGKRVPVVGKICMDQLMVKLPGRCEQGTEVILIGRQGDEVITFAELAGFLGSVPQEISTSLTGRVERIYTRLEEPEREDAKFENRIYRRNESGKAFAGECASGGASARRGEAKGRRDQKAWQRGRLWRTAGARQQGASCAGLP